LSGFSLIEMLVVVLVFSTVAVILSQIFVGFNRLQRKVSNAAVLGQDMRFAMEATIRSIRTVPLDYSAYTSGIPTRDNRLRLRKPTGEKIELYLVPGATCGDASVTQCLALTTDGGSTFQPITAKRVNVKNFDVYVRPDTNPFVLSGGSYPNNTQPFVTINLSLEYIADNPRDKVTLQAQTTVATRLYQR